MSQLAMDRALKSIIQVPTVTTVTVLTGLLSQSPMQLLGVASATALQIILNHGALNKFFFVASVGCLQTLHSNSIRDDSQTSGPGKAPGERIGTMDDIPSLSNA